MKKRRDSRPLYARVLRLKHIRPGSVLCFVFFELTIFVAAVLGFAELISWWMVPVLPLVVAVMVKLNDIIAGAAAGPSPVTAPDVADDDELVDYWSPRTEEEQGGYAEPRTVRAGTDDVAAPANPAGDAEPAATAGAATAADTEAPAGTEGVEVAEGIEPARVVEVGAGSAVAEVADKAGTRDDTRDAEKLQDGAPEAEETPADAAGDTPEAAELTADEADDAPGGREATPDGGEDAPEGGEARAADSGVPEDGAATDDGELPTDPAEVAGRGEGSRDGGEAPTIETPTISVVTPPAPRAGTPPNGTAVPGRGSGEGDGAAEPVPELRRR